MLTAALLPLILCRRFVLQRFCHSSPTTNLIIYLLHHWYQHNQANDNILQMAVETALSYVAQIRSAIERNQIDELAALTLATETTTTATWDLVYAQLKLLNVSGDLNDTMYAGALQNRLFLQIDNLFHLVNLILKSLYLILDFLLNHSHDIFQQIIRIYSESNCGTYRADGS